MAAKKARGGGRTTDEYAESLKRTVKLLRSGWYGAKELQQKLNVSYQTPYNRIRQLVDLGFTVEYRTDRALRGSLTRWHIPANGGDTDIIDGLL